MEFRYELTGHGWADCRVEIGGQHAEVVASYLTDALDDLCAAVAAVLRGDPAAGASWDGEPVEFRWRLDRAGTDRLRVRVLQLADGMARRPDDEAQVLLDAECRLRTFAGAVLSELQRIDREHGEAGYRRLWLQHAFPRRRLEQLQSLLAA